MTLEEVTAAVDAIEARGGVPSIRAVRAELGRGNMGQIGALLRQIDGRQNGHAEIARLRRRVVELEAEVATLKPLAPWALALYFQHVESAKNDPQLLFQTPPPIPPRTVTAEKQAPLGWAWQDGVLVCTAAATADISDIATLRDELPVLRQSATSDAI